MLSASDVQLPCDAADVEIFLDLQVQISNSIRRANPFNYLSISPCFANSLNDKTSTSFSCSHFKLYACTLPCPFSNVRSRHFLLRLGRAPEVCLSSMLTEEESFVMHCATFTQTLKSA